MSKESDIIIADNLRLRQRNIELEEAQRAHAAALEDAWAAGRASAMRDSLIERSAAYAEPVTQASLTKDILTAKGRIEADVRRILAPAICPRCGVEPVRRAGDTCGGCAANLAPQGGGHDGGR